MPLSRPVVGVPWSRPDRRVPWALIEGVSAVITPGGGSAVVAHRRGECRGRAPEGGVPPIPHTLGSGPKDDVSSPTKMMIFFVFLNMNFKFI